MLRSSLRSKVLIVFICIVLLPSTTYATSSSSSNNQVGITKELLKQMEADLQKVELHKREEFLAKFRDEHTLYRYVEPASEYSLFSTTNYGDTRTVTSYTSSGVLVTNSRNGLWYDIITLSISTIIGVWRPVEGILTSVVALVGSIVPDTSRAAAAETLHSYTYTHKDAQVYMPNGPFGSYWGTLATSTSRATYHHERGWFTDKNGVSHLRNTKSNQLVRSEYANHYFDHAGLERLAYNAYNTCKNDNKPDVCMIRNTYTESW